MVSTSMTARSGGVTVSSYPPHANLAAIVPSRGYRLPCPTQRLIHPRSSPHNLSGSTVILSSSTGSVHAAGEELEALEELLRELDRTFRSPEHARAWLDREVRQLGGQRPRELLLEGRMERVTAILMALDLGVTT